MEEKIYFAPGELVTIRQELPNKPVMLVLKKETSMFYLKNKVTEDKKVKEDNNLKGIRCRWFTTDGLLQEAIFNTKDLIKL